MQQQTSAPVTGTYLDRILENTAAELTARQALRSVSDMRALAEAMPAPASFRDALHTDHVALITEVKRASPSKGPIAPGVSALEVAADYIFGGCAAISVLTDERFFHGSLADLEAVAAAASIATPPRPVLRKDFVLDEYQILEARAAGASAVLLIVAALEDVHLRDLLLATEASGLQALVEIHDEAELERALAAGADIIGINSRDLRSFTVDLATIERVAAQAPDGITLIGESGVQTRADVERLSRAGVHAVLVGESLMRAEERAAAVRALLVPRNPEAGV